MKILILLISVSVASGLFASPEQLISSISIKGQTITYRLNKEFHATYLRDNFFVTYQHDINLMDLDYSIITMPLIMNTISIIWISGKEYYIESMDKNLYESLEIVHEIFKRFYPKTSWNGRLIPKKLIESAPTTKNLSSQIAIPFSNGLDSVCTSIRYHDTPQLLMTVRGCPDTPLDSWNVNWQTTQKAISHFAKTHGHNVSYVHSNFHEFFDWDLLRNISPEITNWRMDTIEDLGWIGLAAPIVVAKNIQKLVLASNEDWSILHPGASCPLVIDTVSFKNVTITCDAFDMCRPEKNNCIATICTAHALEKPKMFVCEHVAAERKNCCKCQKCAITILSFLLINEDPKAYGFAIDRDDFLNHFKTEYFKENLYSPHRACWFKYAQLKAKEKLHTYDAELAAFFAWYITIDFNKLTLPNPQVTIDYDLFCDLWDGIPANWRDARTSLQNTHIPGTLSDEDYTVIWEKNNLCQEST